MRSAITEIDLGVEAGEAHFGEYQTADAGERQTPRGSDAARVKRI